MNTSIKKFALLAVGAWGAIHLVGGLAILAETAGEDGVSQALRTLGSENPTVPGQIGETAESVIRFHAFNIAWIGATVLALAIAMRKQFGFTLLAVTTALVAFADVGLVAFMIAPGVTTPADGLPGVALALIGLPAAWLVLARAKRHGTGEALPT